MDTDLRSSHKIRSVTSIAVQRVFDPALSCLVLTMEAFGVDTEEHFDAVAGLFGDLGCGDAAVEPGGQARVAQVVGPPRSAHPASHRIAPELIALPGVGVDTAGQLLVTAGDPDGSAPSSHSPACAAPHPCRGPPAAPTLTAMACTRGTAWLGC